MTRSKHYLVGVRDVALVRRNHLTSFVGVIVRSIVGLSILLSDGLAKSPAAHYVILAQFNGRELMITEISHNQ